MATDIKAQRGSSAPKQIDDETIRAYQTLKEEAKKERDLFTDDWKIIENQVNCIHPEEWKDKEDWQTKIYLPLQLKALEAGVAIMDQMLIGQRKWFGFAGVDKLDKAKETDLVRFIEILLEEGKFDLNNQACFQQAVGIGNCFLDLMKVKGEPKINFRWRNCKNILFDPRAVLDWDDARYFIKEFNLDIREVMASKEYTAEGKDNLLQFLHGKPGGERGDHIQMFSAEGDTEYRISKKYQEVAIDEFWGWIPVKKEKEIEGKMVPYMETEFVFLVIAEDHVILQQQEPDLDFIPTQRGRMKPKMDHGYGNGMLKAGIGFQKLANSIVNLGMDSAKISYLPQVIYETDAIVDSSALDIRPLGRIELKSGKFGAYQLHRFNVNSMPEVTAQLALIDQAHQEATGITRQAQGTETDFGQDETLGQTEIKMQAVERRMLMTAKQFGEEYILGVLRKLYKIITHPKYIKQFQEKANRTIGMKKSPIVDGQTGEVIGEAEEPRVNLVELGRLDLDFKPIGLVNFVQKTEILKKLDNLLQRAEASPTLQKKVKMEEVFERAMDLADIPDHDELMKTDQEIQQEEQAKLKQLQQIQAIQAQNQFQGGGGGNIQSLQEQLNAG